MAAFPPAVVLLLGLVVLLGGGELLVRGATALARSFGVTPLVIGMTVVAFGTSAPELAVNIAAAWTGKGAITFGNVLGSNIANIGLILGLTALIHTLDVKDSLVRRETPAMLASTLAVILFGFGILPTRGSEPFSRPAGFLLLAAFVVFLVWINRRSSPEVPEDLIAGPVPGRVPSVFMTFGGLLGVLLGSHWTVQGASRAAHSFGVGEGLIGLTIVAIGTSLPELTTSLFAVRKGHADLAIGNIVGSNIFNLLFILGVSAGIRPVPVPRGGSSDLVALGLFSLVLLPFAGTRKSLSRGEGFLLLTGYLAYMSWRSFF